MEDERQKIHTRLQEGSRCSITSGQLLANITGVQKASVGQQLSNNLRDDGQKMTKPQTNSYQKWWPRGSSSDYWERRTERPEKRLRMDSSPESQSNEFAHHQTTSPIQELTTSPTSKSRKTAFVLENDMMSDGSFEPCANCHDTGERIGLIVSELLNLQAEISQSTSRSLKDQDLNQTFDEIFSHKSGLKHALAWMLDQIRYISRLLPRARTSIQTVTTPNSESIPPPFATEKRQIEATERSTSMSGAVDGQRILPRVSNSTRDEDLDTTLADLRQERFPHPHQKSLPPIVSLDEMKRSIGPETGSVIPQQSSPQSSTSSVIGSLMSPNQTIQLQKTLPSPASSNNLPSTNAIRAWYPPSLDNSAHTAHFQDLQHQVSTKTLALQTLQREHDQLLAAFSRSQIRCGTLEKKTLVSDHEISTLNEEKIRLSHQVESIEAQLEDLSKSRNELHQQSTADGLQWRQIMAMSSQLQVKGMDEARRYKSDRDAWERDRKILQERIEQLEVTGPLSPKLQPSRGSSPITTITDNGDDLTSQSVDPQRDETLKLRRRYTEMARELEGLANESKNFDQLLSSMTNFRARLTSISKLFEENQEV